MKAFSHYSCAVAVVAVSCVIHPANAFWFNIASAPPLFFNPPSTTPAKTVVPDNVKVLILPGFGNDASDYILPRTASHGGGGGGSLLQSLVTRGWNADTQVRVMPLERREWLNVFVRGALDTQFWLDQAPPTRPAYRWYLDRVAEQVSELTADNETTKVVLVGHSAGGWLARAALGYYGSSSSYATEDTAASTCRIDLNKICGIVTLGAPHVPPPPEVMDVTRGALRLTSETFPGAHHNDDDLFYITVSGGAVRGVKQEKKNPLEATSATGFAYTSYQAVCGNGEVTGDGVVPQCAAHLEGATQIHLEDIFHSINVPDRWYGSDSVIDSWHSEMLQQIASQQRAQQRANKFTSLNTLLERIFA